MAEFTEWRIIMKKIVKLIIALLVAVLLVAYIPYYINTCDDCDKMFFGPGYDANIVMEAISEDDYVICKDCAELQHAISSLVGKSVDEYRRPLFKDPVTLLIDLFS